MFVNLLVARREGKWKRRQKVSKIEELECEIPGQIQG